MNLILARLTYGLLSTEHVPQWLRVWKLTGFKFYTMPTKQKSSILIACEEANHYCDKGQYKESSLMEKIKLNIHVLFCRACQKYSSNNGKLTKLMKKEKIESFDTKEKNELEQLFQQKIKQTE